MLRYWYQTRLHPLVMLLLPFTFIFKIIIFLRHFFYHKTWFKTYQSRVPVIVVGNITVGGTGKTPFVIWLAQFLQTQGYHVGLISRGFGGEIKREPYLVKANDHAKNVGDEALLLIERTKLPLVICKYRAKAAQFLLQKTNCNIIIADDGLQHYALARDIEIVMIDGVRYFGNQQLLPAGPLREPIKRLQTVDFKIVTGNASDDYFAMTIHPDAFIALQTKESIDLKTLPKRIHAVAGIGHPERFFATLQSLGFDVIPHVFPDHYLFQAADLNFADALPIIMTEKDAMKCKTIANEKCLFLRIVVKMDKTFEEQLLEKLRSIGRKFHDSEEDFSQPICIKHAISSESLGAN